MMSVPVTTGDSFSAGRPNPLFDGMYHYNVSQNRTYDVTSDGRFIMVALPDPSSTPRQVIVILNRLNLWGHLGHGFSGGVPRVMRRGEVSGVQDS